MSPGARWIAGIIATLAGGVIAVVTMMVFAQRANAGRIVADYYQRAAHYDDAIAAADASRALGWVATVALAPDGARVCVRDRAGQPLAAQIEVTAAHRAHPGAPAIGGAALGGDGCATVALTLARGDHDVTLTAVAGAERFVATAAREVE
ncbi:MAG: FixH family protein [Myxococcales bacterium]|nr:FixH family protein [Myxococcales bacterium]